MKKNPKDIKADIIAAADRGEATMSMEPLLLGSDSRHLARLSISSTAGMTMAKNDG
jgi:hypothetical protein